MFKLLVIFYITNVSVARAPINKQAKKKKVIPSLKFDLYEIVLLISAESR